MRELGRERWRWALLAVVLAGTAVRFATLDVQSLWLDEAVTHDLVTRSLGGMLRAIPGSESTPPLYYVLAWGWVRLFGAGAVGLRSLSALFGSATIAMMAAIGYRVAGWRASLAAAALVAASPLLIWYSQEARAYALLVLLSAVTLWCLLREDWRGWAIAAALALATHYFAVFIVVPEAVWMLWRHGRSSRGVRVAIGFVIVVGAALLPLAVDQAGGSRAAFIRSSPLGTRVAEIPKQFLTGYATPSATVLTIVAALLAVGLAPALRARDRGLLALAALAVGVPIVLALAGGDFVITRNLIAATVPLIALAAAAASRTRTGPLLVAGICAAGVVAFVGVETNPAYQRDDWRGVAAAIGPPTVGPRVIVIDQASGLPALALYLPLSPVPAAATTSVSTREIDVVLVGRNPPAPPVLPLAGFAPDLVHTGAFTLVRYFAAVPISESYAQFVALGKALVPSLGPVAALSG